MCQFVEGFCLSDMLSKRTSERVVGVRKEAADKTLFDAHVTAQTQNEDTDVFQKLFLPNIC
jgi:hypothetical protein